jgi:CubicO group peptidase (beta-lactamase class C family)
MTLPRSTPLEQGVDAGGIDAFIAAVGAMKDVELHSLMVLRHGHVVAEDWWHPYAPETPHLLYSLSKSFTSTALGFAVDEGLVDLDATVLSYFPEFDDVVTDPRSRSIKVRHVAAMASGHDEDTFERAQKAGDGDLLLGFLLTPPDREPGTVFAYNQPCTFAVAAIVQRVSGGTLTDFLRPRLYEPLGITAYGWQKDRFGREIGFAGLHVATETIAKVGQLYLDGGVWAGRQLLSAEWIAEATRSHITPDEENPDWRQGYGFQFWHSRHGYRGDGAYSQYMLILPEAGAVVAITSQSPDMQGLLDAVWAHLLPALTAETGPAGAWSQPAQELSRPRASGPAGELTPATFRPGGGNELSSLRTIELRSDSLILADNGPELTAALGGADAWTLDGPVATAYAWVDGRLAVDVVFVETPHRLHLRLDPASGTFAARWETEPLGAYRLARLRMPG